MEASWTMQDSWPRVGGSELPHADRCGRRPRPRNRPDNKLSTRHLDHIDLAFRKITRKICQVRIGQRWSNHRHRVVLSRTGLKRLQLCDDVRLDLGGDVWCVRSL